MFRVIFISDNLNFIVNIHTRTGRDKFTDNNIFLKTEEHITFALDSGIGKSLCCFLE